MELSPAEVTAVEESEFEFRLMMICVIVAALLLVLLLLICRTNIRKDHNDNRCSAQFIADNENV